MYTNSSTRFSGRCLPDDDNLSPKHVGGFMCLDDLWLYINFVHLLVYTYVGDCERYCLQNVTSWSLVFI